MVQFIMPAIDNQHFTYFCVSQTLKQNSFTHHTSCPGNDHFYACHYLLFYITKIGRKVRASLNKVRRQLDNLKESMVMWVFTYRRIHKNMIQKTKSFS